MQPIDHGILEAGVMVGLFGQCFAVFMNDDCIRRRWLEHVCTSR